MRRTIIFGFMAGHRCLQGCALAAMLMCCYPWPALAAEGPARFAIHQPAQPLADSLRAVARQTGVSLIFDPKAVAGLSSAPISGQFSAAEAVQRMLQGSGLALTVQPDGALVVRPTLPASRGGGSQAAPVSGAPSVLARDATLRVERLALAAAEGGLGAAVQADAGPDPKGAQKIEITGSRLRRIDGDGALPVNTYGREEIEKSGQPSLGRFLASLNEISMGQGEGSFSTTTQGQGNVQLRGLPLGSTLVLVNGRRVQAVGSSNGSFFNLNLIPIAAVERVEIVPVGSSAVYGGDALAGVVNVILRKSIDGQTFNVRATTGRGFGEGGVSLGAGDAGPRGSWLMMGSYNKATPLNMEEREFFGNSDFRRFGGTDVRVRNCSPGTVTSTTSANLPGLNSSFAAIPATTPGQPLTVASFAATAGQANLCSGFSANGATALVHGSESLSLHAAGQRNLVGSLEAFGELTYVQDRVKADGLGLNFNNIVVPETNPNNPFGVPVRVTARLGVENGREAYTRDTDFARALAGIRGDVGGWDYEAAASVSRDWGNRTLVNNTVNAAARTAALSTSNPAASLNPFSTGRAASDEVLRGIWSDTVRDTVGRKDLVNAFTRGPLFELPAGSVDAIVGAEAARDHYQSISPTERFVNSRSSGAAYAEVRVPLWAGMSDGRRDGSQAALTLAARRDRYSDFGSASTYQAGLELRPARSLLLRASAASSFKPPTLLQTSVQETISLTQNPGFTDPRRNNEPIIDGQWIRTTNKDLRPENGKAFALGAVWEPGGESGLRLAGTAWRVRIDELIGLLSSQVVINNETLFPGWVTREPSSGGLPGRITRVLFMESNFGYVETGGFDFEATQSWQTPSGRWTVGASATRTTKYDVVIVPGAPVTSRLGRRFPAEYWSPTWKGRLTAGLDRGTWSVGIASRYVAAYKDVEGSDRVLGGGWVHDLSGRLDLKRLGLDLGPAKAAALSLSIVNAGNKLPEYAGSSPYYDTAQADWRGRYASVRLSVDW